MPNRLKLLYIENLLILVVRRLYICSEIKSCKNSHDKGRNTVGNNIQLRIDKICRLFC